MCMKNAALGDVSQNQYSSWLCLILYLSLNTPPLAVFYVHACSSALSSSYIKCMVSICMQGVILGGFNSFLDLNIYKGPNFLSTKKLYVETHIKPTNRQAYIHAHSHHPPGASKGVAIGELKRYLRTNSQNSTFNKFKAHHMRNLRKRGYSNGFINNYTNKVRFLDRSFELKPKIKRPFKKTVFVTRFTPSAKPAMHVIKKYWPSIQHLKIFNNNPLPTPMLSYKSNKNLKSFLVRAKLPSLDCTTETTPTSNLTLEYTPIPSSTTDNEDRLS